MQTRKGHMRWKSQRISYNNPFLWIDMDMCTQAWCVPYWGDDTGRAIRLLLIHFSA